MLKVNYFLFIYLVKKKNIGYLFHTLYLKKKTTIIILYSYGGRERARINMLVFRDKITYNIYYNDVMRILNKAFSIHRCLSVSNSYNT